MRSTHSTDWTGVATAPGGSTHDTGPRALVWSPRWLPGSGLTVVTQAARLRSAAPDPVPSSAPTAPAARVTRGRTRPVGPRQRPAGLVTRLSPGRTPTRREAAA